MIQLTYPDADNWMWDYCIYLGPYQNPETGLVYDLGVYQHPDGKLSMAIVFGNRPGDYLSGELSIYFNDDDGSQRVPYIRPEVIETINRANAIGLTDLEVYHG